MLSGAMATLKVAMFVARVGFAIRDGFEVLIRCTRIPSLACRQRVGSREV